MAYATKHTTRGKIYKHLKDYVWTFKPPRMYHCMETERLREEQRRVIEELRQETDHAFRIARLEINMRYNELCTMDNEDKDIGPNVINLCDSDDEDIQGKEVIDLTNDSDSDFSDPEFILDGYESMPESVFDE